MVLKFLLVYFIRVCIDMFFEVHYYLYEFFFTEEYLNQDFPKLAKWPPLGPSYFKTYTRYSGVDDDEQKKVLGVFNGSFLSNLIEGSHRFFNFFQGGHLKKAWETLI